MGYIFIIPWVIGFCLFFLYPLFYSLALSFSQITDLATFKLEFVKFNNYVDVFTKEVNFYPELQKSLQSLIQIPIVIVFSLFVATLLNRKIRFRWFFRVAFLLPLLLGTGPVKEAILGEAKNRAAVSVVSNLAEKSAEDISQTSFKVLELSRQIVNLLGPQIGVYVGGIVNAITSSMWMSGIQIIIFLGVLQTIPNEFYEASVVDGASEFDKLWKITLPLTMPAVVLNVVYTLIDSFTNIGNPVIVLITKVSFTDLALCYGSAMSWIYFLIVGAIIAIAFAIMRRFTFYMG